MPEEFKMGDIVCCGKSGWWRVKESDPINKNKMIIELVLDAKGNIPRKNPRRYSAWKQWCQKITVDSVMKNKEMELKKWDRLLFILDPSLEIEDESITKGAANLERPEPDYLINIGPPPSLMKK